MATFGRRTLILGGVLSAATAAFPGRATAATAAWTFPEHRTAARLAADRAPAGRQVRALAGEPERARQILARIRARQSVAPGRGVPFDERAGLLVARADGPIIPLLPGTPAGP